jgi:hypothetical protein
VIAIVLGPRFVRAARKLGPDSRAKAEAALGAVADQFGDPHRHGGLGLRKLARRLWECRIDLELRIVFIQDQKRLRAYDIMTHDELRAWLKNR